MLKFTIIFALSLFAIAESCRVIEQKANGVEQSRESHPYLVLLETFLNFEQKYLCSGVLVSGDYVLTTASCVFGALFVNVHVYAHKLRDVFETEREIYRSTEVFLKPEFDGFNHINDVALVKLPATLNIAERPYAIAQLPTDRLNAATEGILIGWGLLNFKDDNAAPVKQSQLVKTLSDESCGAVDGKWNDATNYEGRICVQKATGSNCVSDSGSPFMIGNIVFGLHSFWQEAACGSEAENGLQEVFYHVSWINSIIA